MPIGINVGGGGGGGDILRGAETTMLATCAGIVTKHDAELKCPMSCCTKIS